MLEPADLLVRETEADKVDGWRLHQLIEAGYAVDDAVKIAARHELDLHQAVELVGRGCNPELAAAILL